MNKTFLNKNTPEISILLPCLNEEKSIPYCLKELRETVHNLNAKNGTACEVIVVDNGSTDNSAALIREATKTFPELILANEPARGYGSAYLRGLSVARGKYIFMADMDGSYDFRDLPKFISKLKEGYGLVVGNRFGGKISGTAMEKSAMPWHHRRIGNPVLSYLVKICFGVPISDMHCGMRAMTSEAIKTISPQTAGMEFASEMIVKAAKRNVRMTEIPIVYKKRLGESKLRSISDGWRHLRFILIYCPTALFLVPGTILFFAGIAGLLLFYFSSPDIFGIQFYIHPMFLASAMVIVGFQFIFFTGFARIYAVTHLGDQDQKLERLFRYVTIEKAGITGIIAALAGMGIYAWIFVRWIHSGFGSLDEVKNSIVALTLIVLGIETISSAFMLSILGIKEK
jgi:glycosyltransferase involved in cell wall biosynthesis